MLIDDCPCAFLFGEDYSYRVAFLEQFSAAAGFTCAAQAV
jgi:hypothetical protein